MAPRVIHTGQVVVDVTMQVDRLPERGGEVFADAFSLQVGGGFNVLHAIRRMDVEAVYTGPVGDGLLGRAVVAALERDGVTFTGPTVEGLDTGICVAVTDADAERTFLSTWGAEARLPVDAYDAVVLGAQDVLYISGYSFIDPANRAALERLARARGGAEGRPGPDGRGAAAAASRPDVVPPPVRALVDTSPMIGDAPIATLEALMLLRPIWSANERETRILAARLGVETGPADPGEESRPGPADADIPALCAGLARRLGSPVISRVGAAGAWWCPAGGGGVRRVPSIPVAPVDTNGAGDAHAGVLCALLAEGADLPEALRMANIAGALSTTHAGPATCPSREEIAARL